MIFQPGKLIKLIGFPKFMWSFIIANAKLLQNRPLAYA